MPSARTWKGDTTNVVLKAGGKVIGGVKHPLNTSDFSSFLLQAQGSKAKVSVLPMPAATPSTRSSRRRNSGLTQAAARSSRRCSRL